MELTCYGWKNKEGTQNRECKCGSWKQHWINFSGKEWPEKCSVFGCVYSDARAHLARTFSTSLTEGEHHLHGDCTT